MLPAISPYSALSAERSRSAASLELAPEMAHVANAPFWRSRQELFLLRDHAATSRARDGTPRSYRPGSIARSRPFGARLRCQSVRARPPRPTQRFKRGARHARG